MDEHAVMGSVVISDKSDIGKKVISILDTAISSFSEKHWTEGIVQ